MAEEVKRHETSTSLASTAPAELFTGGEMALKVGVSCASACDLRGKAVQIIGHDAAVVKEATLTAFDGTANETDTLVVRAPDEPGEYTWMAAFPAQGEESNWHGASSTAFSFTARPHETSIAVWDVPALIVSGDTLRFKVGVHCAAGCLLTDQKIEVYNHEATQVATATLGDTPWPGTSTLCWAEVALKAPGTEGCYTWKARFPEPDLRPAHKEAGYTFAFRAVRPPAHMVTVEVVDKRTKAPLQNAHVVLYPYRSDTDGQGMAKISVPRGKYDVHIMKPDYLDFEGTTEVSQDAQVKAEMVYFPPDRQGQPG